MVKLKLEKIKDVDEAIKFLFEKANINVEVVNYKYRVYDNDFDSPIKDDKELIDYANEQKEALEEVSRCLLLCR